jgi:hypothetical protein
VNAKKVALTLLALAAVSSGSQMLGTNNFVADGSIKRGTGASPIRLENQSVNRLPTGQKVNTAALEERLSALYLR